MRLALLRAARRDPAAFRLLHFSVQRDHLHLVVEARDERALSSGVRSVTIRIARYVNDLLVRRGPLFADRWHGRALKTPREVRSALLYVLANFRKHSRARHRAGIDPFSSGEWFDGWREWTPGDGRAPPWAQTRCPRARHAPNLESDDGRSPWAASREVVRNRIEEKRSDSAFDESVACVVSSPESWLARAGWRRRGLVSLGEAPAR